MDWVNNDRFSIDFLFFWRGRLSARARVRVRVIDEGGGKIIWGVGEFCGVFDGNDDGVALGGGSMGHYILISVRELFMEHCVARHSNKNNPIAGNPFLLRLYDAELQSAQAAMDAPLLAIAEQLKEGAISGEIELDLELLWSGKNQIYERVLCTGLADTQLRSAPTISPKRFRTEHVAAAAECLRRTIALNQPGRLELLDDPIFRATEEFMRRPCCHAHAATRGTQEKQILRHWASLEHCCAMRGLTTISDLVVARALAQLHPHLLLSTPSPLVAAWHIYQARFNRPRRHPPSDRILYVFQKLIARAKPGVADVLELWSGGNEAGK